MSDFQNERIRRANLLDEVALTKREQAIIKKEYSNKFLQKLDEIIEKCFLKATERKELFVSKEKLVLELLILLQSQKKFKTAEIIHDELCNLSVFDYDSNLIGRVETIYLQTKEVEYITIDSIKNNKPSIRKSFSVVAFFDPYSIKMEKYYLKQKVLYDCYSYKEIFELLTGKIEIKSNDTTLHYSLGRGIPLSKGAMDRSNNVDIKD